MNRLPSGAQLAPNESEFLPVIRVKSDPLGFIEVRRVGPSIFPLWKIILPLSPGNEPLAATGVSATSNSAAIVGATVNLDLIQASSASEVVKSQAKEHRPQGRRRN